MFNVNKNTNNIIDVVLVFLLSTSNLFHTFFSVSIVEFEQVNVCWVDSLKKILTATMFWFSE